MNGFRPFVYTITPFTTLRCLEQIKIDVCYHELPVTIVGTGSGLSYAQLGPTHHSLDDIGIMRSLPNMRVFCPCDPVEVKYGMRQSLKQNSPVYIRLGKKGEPVIHKQNIEKYSFGQIINVRKGNDVCLLSVGNVMPIAIIAREIIEKAGFSCRLDSLCSVKPLDVQSLKNIFSEFKTVCVVEEHSTVGGAKSAILELLSDIAPTQLPKLISCNLDDKFFHEIGTQEEIRKEACLTSDAVATKVINHITAGI